MTLIADAVIARPKRRFLVTFSKANYTGVIHGGAYDATDPMGAIQKAISDCPVGKHADVSVISVLEIT